MTHQTTIDFNAGLSKADVAVRDLIMGTTRERPITIAEISSKTGLGPRDVKDTARRLLVDHGMKIGSSKSRPHGYYLCITADDCKAAADSICAQISSEAQRVRVLLEPHDIRERLGQEVLTMLGVTA